MATSNERKAKRRTKRNIKKLYRKYVIGHVPCFGEGKETYGLRRAKWCSFNEINQEITTMLSGG